MHPCLTSSDSMPPSRNPTPWLSARCEFTRGTMESPLRPVYLLGQIDVFEGTYTIFSVSAALCATTCPTRSELPTLLPKYLNLMCYRATKDEVNNHGLARIMMIPSTRNVNDDSHFDTAIQYMTYWIANSPLQQLVTPGSPPLMKPHAASGELLRRIGTKSRIAE